MFPAKINLANFLKNQTQDRGVSVKALCKEIRALVPGCNFQEHTLLPWMNAKNNDFPDLSELDKLAAWQATTISHFMTEYLDYSRSRAYLLQFIFEEMRLTGNFAITQFARILKDGGCDLSEQKIQRWVTIRFTDFPSMEDLEKFASFKGLSLPEFLIKFFGYPPIKQDIEIEALIDTLPVQKLSQLLLATSAVLNTRCYTATSEGSAKIQSPPTRSLELPKRMSKKYSLAGHEIEKLGLLLSASLQARGWSHQDAAKISGVPEYIISSIIYKPKGHSITGDNFAKIASLICRVVNLDSMTVDCSVTYSDRPDELLAIIQNRNGSKTAVANKASK